MISTRSSNKPINSFSQHLNTCHHVNNRERQQLKPYNYSPRLSSKYHEGKSYNTKYAISPQLQM